MSHRAEQPVILAKWGSPTASGHFASRFVGCARNWRSRGRGGTIVAASLRCSRPCLFKIGVLKPQQVTCLATKRLGLSYCGCYGLTDVPGYVFRDVEPNHTAGHVYISDMGWCQSGIVSSVDLMVLVLPGTRPRGPKRQEIGAPSPSYEK